jgi:hypothetical protein
MDPSAGGIIPLSGADEQFSGIIFVERVLEKGGLHLHY